MTSITATGSLERQPVRGATSCRHCGSTLDLSLVDLGKSPLCQTVLTEAGLGEPEIFYPLHAKVCTRCWLVQIPEFVPPEGIFTEYAYFSAYSDSWVEHARTYVEMIVRRLSLTPDDLVVELASNDGYLLQHFLPAWRARARDRPRAECRGGGDRPRRPDTRGVLRARARTALGRRRETAPPRSR